MAHLCTTALLQRHFNDKDLLPPQQMALENPWAWGHLIMMLWKRWQDLGICVGWACVLPTCPCCWEAHAPRKT